MYMGVLSRCMHAYYLCTWYLRRPEEGVGSCGTGVMGGHELPCVCWELNHGSLQHVLLTDEPLPVNDES